MTLGERIIHIVARWGDDRTLCDRSISDAWAVVSFVSAFRMRIGEHGYDTCDKCTSDASRVRAFGPGPDR